MLVPYKCHYRRERRARHSLSQSEGREHQPGARRNQVALGRRAGEGNRLLLCCSHLSALPNCHSGQKWQRRWSQLIPAKPSAASPKGASVTCRSPRAPAPLPGSQCHQERVASLRVLLSFWLKYAPLCFGDVSRAVGKQTLVLWVFQMLLLATAKNKTQSFLQG